MAATTSTSNESPRIRSNVARSKYVEAPMRSAPSWTSIPPIMARGKRGNPARVVWTARTPRSKTQPINTARLVTATWKVNESSTLAVTVPVATEARRSGGTSPLAEGSEAVSRPSAASVDS